MPTAPRVARDIRMFARAEGQIRRRQERDEVNVAKKAKKAAYDKQRREVLQHERLNSINEDIGGPSNIRYIFSNLYFCSCFENIYCFISKN